MVRKAKSGASGKYPGVSPYRNNRFEAYIQIDGKKQHIGYFDTFEEAKFARIEVEQANPRPVKVPKVRAKSAERRAQSQEHGTAPTRRETEPRYDPAFNGVDLDSLSEDDRARATFDHNRPPSPNNVGRRTLPDETWAQWTADMTIEAWFRSGEHWRFVRLGRTDVWDAEVRRLAELWGCDQETAHDVMVTGRRWRYLTYPREAAHLNVAESLGVGDLV